MQVSKLHGGVPKKKTLTKPSPSFLNVKKTINEKKWTYSEIFIKFYFLKRKN
jgi:hypothetical protein